MAIQTQKFTPLTHRHYKLATTQSELDEEMRRKMALQDQQNAARAGLANMQQQNANNRANAQLKQRQAEVAADQQQQQFTNGLNLRAAERAESNDAYQREQNSLATARQQRLDANKEKMDASTVSLAERRQANDDYTTNRKRQEDARVDAERQANDALKAKVIASGSLGAYLNRQQANGNVGEYGFIDVSEIQNEVFPKLVNGYKNQGKVYAKIAADGNVVFKDDNGPIMNNGNEFRPKASYLSQSAMFAEENALNNMRKAFGMSSKESGKAKTFAYDEYKYYRKAGDEMRESLRKLEAEMSPPKEPEKGASAEEVKKYNAAIAPYEAISNKIKYFDRMAKQNLDLYEGNIVQKKDYSLKPFIEPETTGNNETISKRDLINKNRVNKQKTDHISKINGMSKEDMDSYLMSLPASERIKVMEELQRNVNQGNRDKFAKSLSNGLSALRSNTAPGIRHGR